MTAKETKVFNQFNEMSKAYPKIQNGDGGEDFIMKLLEVKEEDESHYTFSIDLSNNEMAFNFDMDYINWSNWNDKVFFEGLITEITENLDETMIQHYLYRIKMLRRS